MPLDKGQSYEANSFELGFINVIPVNVVLRIVEVDDATNELVLTLVSAGTHESNTGLAIARWFKEDYPFRLKEDCMLKNARAFERFVANIAGTGRDNMPGK